MFTPCPTERSRQLADRVETFVRDVVIPYEFDRRRSAHGPSAELVDCWPTTGSTCSRPALMIDWCAGILDGHRSRRIAWAGERRSARRHDSRPRRRAGDGPPLSSRPERPDAIAVPIRQAIVSR
jgi:hypothetical protein